MVRQLVLFYLKFFIFWLLAFLLGRLLFMATYASSLADVSFGETLQSLYAGFRLDLSAVAYLMLVCLVFILILFLTWGVLMPRVLKTFTLVWMGIATFLFGAILGGESGLYAEWNSKLNFKAIHHLVEPSEVMSTASADDTLVFMLYLVFGVLLYGVYRKFFFQEGLFQPFENLKSRLIGLGVSLVLIVLSVIFMRGGLQPIPIITSDAYFTNEDILNDIAVNPMWNIGQSIEQNRRSFDGNPYGFMSNAQANKIVKDLYNYPDTLPTKILTTERPNVVFILLEGWSADVIGLENQFPTLTPHYNKLAKEGLQFDNFYSNGWTSDQGMCAILSAAPVFPHTSVVNQTDKSRNVPSILRSLKDEGYESLFYFGGQLSYGNIKGYLLNQKIDVMREEKDFSEATHRGKLGIHDDYMFQKYLEGINELQEPFVSALFTMSTHSPYDIDYKQPLDINSPHKDYLQSAIFADSCVGDFIHKAQQEPWYDNTLFVFVADHGHNTPIKKRGETHFERNKIPFMMCGNVLVDSLRGSINSKLGSHLDISKTLLNQMNVDTKEYIWSKDLMNDNVTNFFPYVFHYGLGIKTPQGSYRYNLTSQKEYFYTDGDSTILKDQCRAYYQATYEDFMKL